MINYYLVTKPGIILGNVLTVAAGFLLASKGNINYLLFLETLIAIIFIIASACVFNNYIDRRLDKEMARTKNRALVIGLIPEKNAIAFGIILALIGNFFLIYFTNMLTLVVSDVGFFVYVFLYSLWKRKTVYSTAIGSIAGALPPVIGYCAVSNKLDAAALILFAMLILWQMPHFFSIAILNLEDYSRANVPVLPVYKGMLRTKIHMVIYIVAFIPAAILLTAFNYTGYTYLIVTSIIAFAWLILSLKGFSALDDRKWGQQMFRVSLLLILAICIIIPFDISAPQ